MWFAVICEEAADSYLLRDTHRAAHLARLEALEADGRLLMSGAFPREEGLGGGIGFSGNLTVADFDSRADAQRWAHEDPYCKAGVYRNVSVKPFRKLLPAS